jgi:hypothetical protein
MHTHSCANTKGAPTGGPKDTIPPKIVSVYPLQNTINVPTKNTEIKITFDEYIQVKEPNKNILLSPPQEKKIKTKIKGKSLIVTFPTDLDSSKTYSISFGSSIVDNNEGNKLGNYIYSFSTGSTIDSLLFSGTVIDNETLLPLEGISVSLYETPTDSCVLNKLPDAITKTDKWGYFSLTNLKNVPYAIFAFKDDNGNNKYEQDNELIGFADSLIRPTVVMKEKLPQLTIYDEKDTLGALSRPSELDLYLFKEKPTKQFIRNNGRPSLLNAFIKFNAPNVVIDSFSIKGVSNDKIIKVFNSTMDSLSFWIKDKNFKDDTLFLGIKYLKTDSLGTLVSTTENLKLIAPRVNKKKQEEEKRARKERGIQEERKDLLKFKLIALPETIEQTGYIFEFPFPLDSAISENISLKVANPKKIVTDEEFTFYQDSLNILNYILKPRSDFKIGHEYTLKIPEKIFTDINGFTNDSLENKLSLPTDDKLSTLSLMLQDVNTRYIIELINDKRDKVFRKQIINNDTTVVLKYLQAGKYSLRITEDLNGNEILDPGNLLIRKQPEKVRLYKLDDGKEIINIGERIDLEQTINLKKIFK